MTNYGILIFDDVEELDFTGPWEVFTASALLRERQDQAFLISERDNPVRCVKGMTVLPHFTIDTHPEIDVLLVPGGQGTRKEVDNPVLIEWIESNAHKATWATSVCTGVLLLRAAGIALGRRVATHHMFEETLRNLGGLTVVSDARYVIDGNVATSQGVSAGIDMALWLVGKLHGRDHSRAVRRYIQYEPAPPYMADEP